MSRKLAIVAILWPLLPSPGSAQGRPTEPYIESGVCPFECCTYGGWTARGNLQIHESPGRGEPGGWHRAGG